MADSRNHAIRKITTNGVVTTFAGKLGVFRQRANGTSFGAQFDSPSGLAFDADGNLFVSDTGNSTIRKIKPSGAVSTFARNRQRESRFHQRCGGQRAIQFATGHRRCARWHHLRCGQRQPLHPRDFRRNCLDVRGQPAGSGAARTATGTNASFNGPVGLAFDSRTNLFVSDANNNTIRKITPDGTVTTFAGAAGVDGSADGDLSSARFRSPAELVFDRKGHLFVADSFSQTVRRNFHERHRQHGERSGRGGGDE